MKHKTDNRRLFTCLLLLAGAVLTSASTPGNLRIGEYPGSSEKEGREGTSDVFAVDHELVVPFDPATGAATGVRQHKPLTVLKVIDKATPGFHKALATGQPLKTAVLDFYRIDPATREEVKYYTITLRDVRIVGMKTMMPTTFLPENESYRHMEEVRMVYGAIEWNWLPDSVVETDEWARPRLAASPTNGLAPSAASAEVQSVNPTPAVARRTEPSSAKQEATPTNLE
jgi:type VI secretion system secreted protein Hcp